MEFRTVMMTFALMCAYCVLSMCSELNVIYGEFVCFVSQNHGIHFVITIFLLLNIMHSLDEEIPQICGVLVLNDSNAFVYRCRKCDCEFSTGCGLEVHFLYEHMDKANNINNSSWHLTAEEGISIEIDEQNSTFNKNTEEINANIELPALNTPNSPKIHKARKKKKTQNRKSTAVAATKVFYCDMCPGESSFSSLRSIRKHMECHLSNEIPKQCKICGEYSISYEKHLKEVHAIENPYECNYCIDAAFNTDDRRLAHERKHTNGPQPFKHHCNECQRSFRTPGELQQHSNSIHSFLRPFICDLCGKKFPSKQYIRLHLHSHGEKRFECKYCGKKFKTNANKRGHERKIHETSNLQRLKIEFV